MALLFFPLRVKGYTLRTAYLEDERPHTGSFPSLIKSTFVTKMFIEGW